MKPSLVANETELSTTDSIYLENVNLWVVLYPTPPNQKYITFAKEDSSLPKTIIKRLLTVTLVTLKKFSTTASHTG